MYGYVYKTTNLINGKIYIGRHKASQFDDWYKGSGDLLWKAINKYGWDNFKTEILVECNSEDELNSEEIRLIAEHNSQDQSVGYNLTSGGEGFRGLDRSGEKASFYGKHHTKETCKKISETRKRKGLGIGNKYAAGPISEERYNKLLKIHKSKEFRDKVSKTLTGRPLSKERKINIGKGTRKAFKDNPDIQKRHSINVSGKGNPMYGKQHTEETKHKISEATTKQLTGTKWIVNLKTGRSRQVHKEELDQYLSDGWILGRKLGGN